MKKILAALILIFAVGTVFGGTDGDVLEYKSKIGFTNGEDKIAAYDFLENGKKIVIIGERNLQLWDVENARLINSVPHQIPQFAPRGFISTYLLLGLPKFLDWRPFIIDADGKWMITAEKVGNNPRRSAVVRDLQTLKQIAVMDLPNVSTEYVAYDENRNQLLTFGITDKNAAFASWDEDEFTVRKLISINEYKWHQTIRDDQKMLVGSGDTKVLWSGLNIKQGDHLTLRDIKSGAIEKEYTAQNLKPETAFQETTVSADEELLISKRNERIFVWEIDGGGQPKFEISNPNPKGEFSFKEIVDRRFIVVKIDGRLRVYDIEGDGTPKFELSPENPKQDLSFSDIINERFVFIRADNKLRVYDTLSGNKLKYEIAPNNPKDTIEWRDITGDGRYIAVADDQKASVFEVSGAGKPLYEIVRNSEKERFPTVKFLEDRRLLAVARVNRSEKKEPRTEFYDIVTGKLVFDAAFEAGSEIKFTPNGKYIYQTGLGSFSLWNIDARRLLEIKLEYYAPDYDSSTPEYLRIAPQNTEFVEFSPDYRYILRYGDVTEVYETATGNRLQDIFDAQNVKYDKQNKIKNSGLGHAGWINNGKFVYAFEPVRLFKNSRTVSFWQVKK
jgi:WD40 repeat protein